jgi:uncharacterized Zn finger protein (UPF0148 family)
MAMEFAKPGHVLCPECGEAVQPGAEASHACDPQRWLEHLFRVRDEVAEFDGALAAYLDTPQGRFAQWLAERRRRLA